MIYGKLQNNTLAIYDSTIGGVIILADGQAVMNPTVEMLTLNGWKEIVFNNPQSNFYTEKRFVETDTKIEQAWELCGKEDATTIMIASIDVFDNSDQINLFYLNATPMWLSKSDRVSLSYAVNLSKDGGAECVTIWTTGDAPVPYSIHPDVALAILKQLEVYAMACYNATQQHKRNVMALETAAEVVGYDYRAGYPEVLRFEM